MNQKQSKLFQKVLEQMEKASQEYINDSIAKRLLCMAQRELNDLEHVLSVLGGLCTGKINRDDMNWVIEWLKADNFDLVRYCNTGICSKEECDALVWELVDMQKV